MLYTQKNSDDYNSLAKYVINYAKKSGYEEIKADFSGYESPAALRMINDDITLTPDFTAKRGDSKYYFELAIKNEEDQTTLISKWKALETIAKMKGGQLRLFVPRGSYKFAEEIIQDHNIDAKLTKIAKA
jgi:hypothetical protein